MSAKYLTPERYQLGHLFPVLHFSVVTTAKPSETSRFDFKTETRLPQLLQDFQIPKLAQGTQAPSGSLSRTCISAQDAVDKCCEGRTVPQSH